MFNFISKINTKIDGGLEYLNKNLYFIGLMMVLLNIGSKFIVKDLSKIHNRFLESPFMRSVSLFVVVFIATRNIKVSIILASILWICINILFNFNSKFCILPKYLKKYDLDNDNKLSPEEIKKAYLQLKKEGKIN